MWHFAGVGEFKKMPKMCRGRRGTMMFSIKRVMIARNSMKPHARHQDEANSERGHHAGDDRRHFDGEADGRGTSSFDLSQLPNKDARKKYAHTP